MLIIGEKINGAIGKVKEAVRARDEEFIIDLARSQLKNAADIIDVNLETGDDEIENLVWATQIIQRNLDVPLMLDSGNPDALLAAVEVCEGRPIINSISAEGWKMDKLLPLVREKDCGVVALCMDDSGVPPTPSATFDVAAKLMQQLVNAGIKIGDIYIDPLVLTFAADFKAAQRALETIRLVRQKYPEVHTIMGISNISFGLPSRRLFNRAFLVAAITAGLDSFLVDVNDKSLMAMVYAANLLSGNDEGCRSYLKAYREGMLE